MKKKLLAVALSAITLAASCGALAACNSETQYNVINSNREYTFERYKKVPPFSMKRSRSTANLPKIFTRAEIGFTAKSVWVRSRRT